MHIFLMIRDDLTSKNPIATGFISEDNLLKWFRTVANVQFYNSENATISCLHLTYAAPHLWSI